MTRKSVVYFFLMLLLFILLSVTAGAEEQDPATPTDLDCAHEHTKTTIYFFDSPVYESISAEAHLVTGPATIETVCLDCGDVLASETVDNTEEIRPHSMKKGVCALCGYKSDDKTKEASQTDDTGERIIIIREETDTAEELLTLTLTGAELDEMEKANISTAVIRGETGNGAIALDVKEMHDQTERAGADLYVHMAERKDGSLFAGLFLVSDPGNRTEPDYSGISLRFYVQTRSKIRVSMAPADADTLIETESVWNEKGYWSVPYIAEGTYFLLQ